MRAIPHGLWDFPTLQQGSSNTNNINARLCLATAGRTAAGSLSTLRNGHEKLAIFHTGR